jgi:hypothetical protein
MLNRINKEKEKAKEKKLFGGDILYYILLYILQGILLGILLSILYSIYIGIICNWKKKEKIRIKKHFNIFIY